MTKANARRTLSQRWLVSSFALNISVVLQGNSTRLLRQFSSEPVSEVGNRQAYPADKQLAEPQLQSLFRKEMHEHEQYA